MDLLELSNSGVTPLAGLSDQALTAMLIEAAADERRSLAVLLVALGEFEDRKLAEGTVHGSLYRYCTQVLKYSEDAAYKRIRAARRAKQFPSIIRRVISGDLSLSILVLLSPHLTSENYRSLLDRTRGMPKRKVEALVARLEAPQPAPREVIRHLPPPPIAAGPVQTEGLLLSAPVPEGRSSAEMIRFSFNGSEAFLAKVDRCKQLLRHTYPQGKLEDLFDEAVEALLDARDPDRRKEPQRRESDPKARRIPAWVRDAVWKRDGGCCVFMDDQGLRCSGRDFLEYDHVVPWARGGPSDDPSNIRVLCRAHNQHEARRVFGQRIR